MIKNLLIAASLFLVLPSHAQKLRAPSISFHFEGGYGLSFPSETILQTDETAFRTQTESVSLKTGGGLQLAAGLGIELRNNFRFLVHAHFTRGASTSVVNKVERTNINGGTYIDDVPLSYSYSSFSVSPLIQYRMTDLGGTWYPTFSFGPSLYVWGTESFTEEFYVNSSNYYLEGETKMAISLGGRASLGLERKLGDKLFLSIALQLRSAVVAPNLREVTLIEEEGVDITSQFTVSELQTEYVKNYETTTGPTPSSPTPSPYRARGFTAADFVIGLSYFFN